MFARVKFLGSRVAPMASVVAALLLLASQSFATPVVWSIEAGGNGHTYNFVPLSSAVSWEQANAQAEAAPLVAGEISYLATIRSAEEQAFIQNAVLPPVNVGVNKNQVWIGGQQNLEPLANSIPSTPSAGWNWIMNTEVSPESWSYTNWLSEHEPSNDGQIDERFLTMWVHFYQAGQDLRGTWNDEKSVAPTTSLIIGMIVESAVPEPATAALSALGIALLALRRRRS